MSTKALRQQLTEIRERADYLNLEDRSLPTFAWPGGYPIFYLDAGGEILCADCATIMLDDETIDERNLPIDSDVHWEGPSEYCAECRKEIESAYGDPDAEEENAPE